MPFDSAAYGPQVSAILSLDGAGERMMSLAEPVCSSEEARTALDGTDASSLFPQARAKEAALAGLYLYFGCWQQAHQHAQDIPTPEGSYWHAIFPALRERAAALGVDLGPRWDPIAFIELCERARRASGSPLERQALEVQRAEWQLLFDYCAAGK